MSQQIGYLRVSSVDQNLGRQLDGIELHKRFEDKCSGSTRNRPGLEACLAHIREGDVLHVHSIDRLARNTLELLEMLKEITGNGIQVKFHKENLTFSGEADPMQDLQLQIMSAVAQFERALIRERQREGLAKAKADGKQLGAPIKLGADDVALVRSRRAEGVGVAQLARDYNVARTTIYKVLA